MKKFAYLVLFVFIVAFLDACGDDGSDSISPSEGKESSPEDVLSSSDVQDPEQQPLSSAMPEGAGSCSSVSSSSVSSSSGVSSSSLAESSSSSKPFTIDDMEFVQIGPYEFATKNLNIPVEGSRCYDDLEENCERYGRLYTWAAALAIDESYNYKRYGGLVEPHQGVCPEGTHIVTYDELAELFNIVGDIRDTLEEEMDIPEEDDLIKKLNRGQGGFFDTTGTFVGIDSVAGLWIANESTVNIPSYAWMVTFGNDEFGYSSYIAIFNKTFGAFVRCVKGEAYTIVSSSSEAEVPSSSSKADLTLTVAEGCESATRENWKYLNPDVEYGCIKDSRDGRYYKTLVLDEQMWIAENLRYVPENTKIQSWCLSEKDGECDEFGRYYHGNAVAANPGICPEGFHVPSMSEFQKLIKYEEKSLISVDGWKKNQYSFEGDNATGMSFIPSGVRGYDDGLGAGWETGVFSWVDASAFAWTSTSDHFMGYYHFAIDNYSDISFAGKAAGFGIPIRCVKN